MKNSDMPAMPMAKVTTKGSYNGLDTYDVVDGYEGLTKREMIAMHAMQAMLTSKFAINFNGDSLPDENDKLCERAVSYADALLKELEK